MCVDWSLHLFIRQNKQVQIETLRMICQAYEKQRNIFFLMSAIIYDQCVNSLAFNSGTSLMGFIKVGFFRFSVGGSINKNVI